MGLLDIFGIIPCNWNGTKVITTDRKCVHFNDNGTEVERHK